jgi:hypothetical protein
MILKPRLRRLCKIQVEGTRTMCTLFKEGGGGGISCSSLLDCFHLSF